MTSADVAFKVKFDRTNSPANFELEDTTDYATLGIVQNNVRGNFTNVVDPLGNIIHSNTDFSSPDIAGTSSLLYTGLNIPTDADSVIIPGQYSFTYNVKTDYPVTAVSAGASGTFTIAGNHAAAITSDGSVVVVRSVGNNGTYTVASAVFGGVNTVITITGTVPSATAGGAIQYASQASYTKTATVTYADTVPVVCITVTVDCFCGNLSSQDDTDYTGTTIVSRTHTVKYPAALNKADIVSSGATVLVTPIFTKTWTSIVETTLTVDLGSGNTIQAIITGSKETIVDCDLSLCDISCCLLALDNRYKDARTENPTLADKYFKDLTRMIQLVAEFRMFYECDQHDAAAACLAEIKKIGNCTDACTCSGDEASQVIPLCGGNVNNVQVVQGTGIVVTTTFQNNNYVYQVSLSASMLAIINSMVPTALVAGTGITITSAIVAGVKTWTVTASSPYTAQNRLEFLARIQYTSGAAATIGNSAYLASGSNMNATATTASLNIASVGANNHFRVSGFQVAANNNYKVDVETAIVTLGGVTYTLNSKKTLAIEVFNKASGQFDFRFVWQDGTPITNGWMFNPYHSAGGGSDIYVNIKISE